MKSLYQEKEDTEISDDEAREAWNNLVEYFKMLLEIDQRIQRKTQINY